MKSIEDKMSSFAKKYERKPVADIEVYLQPKSSSVSE
jgi:hypothetical protein